MSNITLCGNTDCKLKDECLRFASKVSDKPHSWLYDPNTTCVKEGYTYYLEVR